MRHLLVLLPLLGIGCDRTGTATLTITRLNETSFTAEDGATEYPITLTSGQLLLSDVNLIDESAPVPTELLDEPSVFDFVANDTFFIDTTILPPKGFEQIHIFIEDAVVGPLTGKTLQLSGTVTLTDASAVNFSVELSLPRSSEEMLAAVSIKPNQKTALQVHFDPVVLLSKIDFDTLGALGDITIVEGSGDPLIDEAISILIDNLLNSFGFDGPIGGDITG